MRRLCRMKSEIAAVVSFLKRLVKLKNKVEVEKMDLFAERLTVALQEKFEGHWVPEKPSKGQAYRCIRVNAFHKYDQELLRACSESGVHYGTKTHNYSSLFFRLSIPRFSLLPHPHLTSVLQNTILVDNQEKLYTLKPLIICDHGIHVLNQKIKSKPRYFSSKMGGWPF
uniref:Anti-proliferative protein domain-containing protein n=1 Tax=Gouania willdenowi TaxID=441366 RepID=A0A8C5DH06_GOUWI